MYVQVFVVFISINVSIFKITDLVLAFFVIDIVLFPKLNSRNSCS